MHMIFKKTHLKVTFALFVSLFLTSCSDDQKKVHESLTNLYLVSAKDMEPKDQELRSEIAKRTTIIFEQNKNIQKLVGYLSSKVSKAEGNNLDEKVRSALNKLEKSDSVEERQTAFMIRKAYLAMLYSDTVAAKIAKISLPKKTKSQATSIKPQNLLEIKDSKIVYKDGNQADYLVIGSGPAGSLIASEIINNDPEARVILVDSGSFVPPDSVDASLDSDFIESNNLRTTTSGSIILRNANVIGGGTTVNIDLAFSPMLALVQNKLSQWIESDALRSDLIHSKTGKWTELDKAYRWVESQIETRKLDQSEVNKNNKILLNASPSARLYDLNQKPFSQENAFLKNSVVNQLLLPAIEKSNGRLAVIPDAYIQKINFQTSAQNRFASSATIEFQKPNPRRDVLQNYHGMQIAPGETATIEAKKIVISAGTLGSAGLLLRSDIKNSNIGKGIVIHPSMGIVGYFDDIIDCHQGLSASVYAPSQDPKGGYIFESMGDVPSFLSLIHPGDAKAVYEIVKDFRSAGGFGIMLVDTPNPNNKVYLNAHGHLDVSYTLNESDKNRLRQGLLNGVQMLFQQGAKKVFIPSREAEIFHGGAMFSSPEEAAQIIEKLQFKDNLNFITSAHMQGSNKLAISGKHGVVSPNFRVFDGESDVEIPNLYVMDSSVFPTSVGANPMQSIYTLAKLFTDKILLKKKEFD